MSDRDTVKESSQRLRDQESFFRQRVDKELGQRSKELDERLAGPLERLARIAKRSPERL
jgi:hypothetical protein